jgi:hypothetical protein
MRVRPQVHDLSIGDAEPRAGRLVVEADRLDRKRRVEMRVVDARLA